MIVVCFCLCLEQNALLQDEYKFYLPLWRQEMKDNTVIKCPNFSVCVYPTLHLDPSNHPGGFSVEGVLVCLF